MKKLLTFFILFFISIGILNSYYSENYLYVTNNSTKVFFTPNGSYKYLFYEGYKVKPTNDFYGNLRKVYLTDGKKAYIDNSKLSNYLDDKYILKSNKAELKSEKFPLYTSANAKGKVGFMLTRGTKFIILNKNLINKIWVRLKVSSGKYSGKIGFIWYKALQFEKYEDNKKRIFLVDNNTEEIPFNSAPSNTPSFGGNNRIPENPYEPEPTIEPIPEPTIEPIPEPTIEPIPEPIIEPIIEPQPASTPEPEKVKPTIKNFKNYSGISLTVGDEIHIEFDGEDTDGEIKKYKYKILVDEKEVSNGESNIIKYETQKSGYHKIIYSVIDNDNLETSGEENIFVNNRASGGSSSSSSSTNTNCTANTNYVHNGHTYNLAQLNHNATQTLTSEQANTPTNGKTTYSLGVKCTNGTITINQSETSNITCNANYHKDGNTCVADTTTTNCTANTNYIHNGHTYNLAQSANNDVINLSATVNNTPTNGKTTYSLSVKCINGSIEINETETSNITCNANYHKDGNTCVADTTNISCTANMNYSHNGHTYILPQLNHNNTGILSSEPVNNTPTNGKTTYLLGVKCINGSIAINQPETISLITCNANYHKVGNTCVVNTTATSADCFTFSNGKITDYKDSCTKDVVIPKKINGVDVTSIWFGTFQNNNLTSVIIPNSVTNIGSFAFAGNNLTSVIIPNSVTSIGTLAFSKNNLASVIIPNSVTNIGEVAFRGNKLTSVTIPNSVTSIGEAAFNNNQLPDNQAFIYARKNDGTEDKTKLISYGGAKRDNVIISDSITSISFHAFLDNNLTSVTIPNSVTSIGNEAFLNNKLTSVTIPNSVTSIGNNIFQNNGPNKNSKNITDWTSGNAGTWNLNGTDWVKETTTCSGGQVDYNGTCLTPTNADCFTFSNGSITDYKNSCTKDVVIPRKINGVDVTSIGNYAFRDNNLISVTIPNSVTSIGTQAFIGNNLTSVTIPNSVTSIGYNIFGNNGLNKDSKDITDWTSGNGGTWKLNGTDWVKETTTLSGWQTIDTNCNRADIKIGTQTWAGCNSTIGNGTLYTNSNVTDKNSEGNLYGKHYTWANRNSACPDGWHVPSRVEWTTLLTNLTCSNPTFPNGRQCNGLGWQNHTTKTASNNLVQALHIPLAGWFGYSFYGHDTNAHLWSSESNGSSDAYNVFLHSVSPSVCLDWHHQAGSFSVRCLKD